MWQDCIANITNGAHAPAAAWPWLRAVLACSATWRRLVSVCSSLSSVRPEPRVSAQVPHVSARHSCVVSSTPRNLHLPFPPYTLLRGAFCALLFAVSSQDIRVVPDGCLWALRTHRCPTRINPDAPDAVRLRRSSAPQVFSLVSLGRRKSLYYSLYLEYRFVIKSPASSPNPLTKRLPFAAQAHEEV